jgi:hypothetical protein
VFAILLVHNRILGEPTGDYECIELRIESREGSLLVGWSLVSICCAHLYSSSLSSFVSGLGFGGLDFDGYFISAHNPVVHHIFAQHKASSTRTEESLCPKHN